MAGRQHHVQRLGIALSAKDAEDRVRPFDLNTRSQIEGDETHLTSGARCRSTPIELHRLVELILGDA